MALKFSLGKKKTIDDVSAAESTRILDTAAPGTAPGGDAGTARVFPQRMRRLGILFAVLALVTAALAVYQARRSADATSHVAAATEMQMLSQQIAKAAQQALLGNADAFTELQAGRGRFAGLLQALKEGGQIDGVRVPEIPDAARPQLDALSEAWRQTDHDTSQLLAQQKNLVTLNAAADAINADNARLLELSEQVAALALQGNANARDIAAANSTVMLTQRIAKNANALRVADAIDPDVAVALGKDANTLREQLDRLAQMRGDAELHARIAELGNAAQGSFQAVAGILGDIRLLVQAKQAGSRIFRDSVPLLAYSKELASSLAEAYRGFDAITLATLLGALLAVTVLVRMARLYNHDVASRRAETEAQRLAAENERNLTQQAILRLMNEMGDLADGDLTVRATVTEDITGAIADSVNYTVEELSVLVRRINDAANRVTAATESAQRTSNELLLATERQSHEIEGAGTTAQRMAESMTASSERALASAQVARRSLDAAHKGAGAVEDTIEGMNDIRDKIQETAKRIKRLGESSQEIGEIVELISDITEQTNVLALNAAIQAASAGEAGRGFTVVAEEVQRLAERSAEATKQIAAIVKTIQTDTQDAVGAMENATRDVVDGARLTDAAGQALAEIGDVSLETARLIEQISSDTQQQAATASRVAATMRDILTITEQTTLGTKQTAVSIGQLADLAVELKGSVSGFKV
ncbi:methyl-accepting chemotaxis protein [Thauera sinica]|uniref:Methyl-accepting chemotaxis protein n=1 Tax=Thauera sinica TaxID=2665146 RepID=A0ABW1AV51_9RHOO|nr:methyl-accepting chemotaxis protein [Thauera sp. K11]ATE62355.1 chemotaxis protein [Thauera sp. K11]